MTALALIDNANLLLLIGIGAVLLVAVGVVLVLVLLGNKRAKERARLQPTESDVEEVLAAAGINDTVSVQPLPAQGLRVPEQQLFAEQPIGYAQPEVPVEMEGAPSQTVPQAPQTSLQPQHTPATGGVHFGSTDEYERLAAEPAPPRYTPFGDGSAVPEPFSWPGPEVGTQTNEFGVVQAAPQQPSPQQSHLPAQPQQQAHMPQEAYAPQQAPAAPAAESDDDDRTVVVPRAGRYALELPDGSRLSLPSNDVVIGRKPSPLLGAALVEIPDPTRTVSKSHVRMRLMGDSWTIEDLSSTNGVYVTDDSGQLQLIEPDTQVAATEHMQIGTLEVRLVRV